MRPGIGCVEGQPGPEATLQLGSTRFILGAGPVVAGEHFRKIWIFQVLLAQLGRGSQRRVPYSVGLHLVEIGAVDQLCGMGTCIEQLEDGVVAHFLLDGKVPLDHTRVFQILVIRPAVTRAAGDDDRGSRGRCARCIAIGKKCPGSSENIWKQNRIGGSGFELREVAGINPQKRIQNLRQARAQSKSRCGPSRSFCHFGTDQRQNRNGVVRCPSRYSLR